MSNTINKAALAEAVRKTSKLRVEDVGGRKERPAETVQSCLNRGYNGLGSDEGLSHILRHAIKYYLSALEPEASPAPLPVGGVHAPPDVDNRPFCDCHQEYGEGLIEALEWYGEQARLCRLIHSEGDAGRTALAADGGKRATAALAKPREQG